MVVLVGDPSFPSRACTLSVAPIMDILHLLDLDRCVSGDLLTILVVVVLEGLLSCDNAVVLALMVKDLPTEQRGKALRYGIFGAYTFLVLALILATWIMSKWYLKVLGGAYLVWLAVRHVLHARQAAADDQDGPAAPKVRKLPLLSVFWSTVVMVEATDMVFSVDSIAAAVALTDKYYVLLLGSMMAVLTMRYAAQGFVKLLHRFPALEGAAFAAVAVIGLKLLLEFPIDVLGLRCQLPPTVSYSDKQGYEQAVAAAVPDRVPALGGLVELGRTREGRLVKIVVGHDLVVVTVAGICAPDLQRIQTAQLAALPATAGPADQQKAQEKAQREYRAAYSSWNLHHRHFLEIENWLSSVLVLGIFGLGFLRRSRNRTLAS